MLIHCLQNNLVEWNKLIKGFSDYLKINISLRDEMNLKKIMGNEPKSERADLLADTTHIGLVSPFKFAQFLKGFGPLSTCVSYVRLSFVAVSAD